MTEITKTERARKVRFVATPITETGPEAVHGDAVGLDPAQRHGHGHVGQRPVFALPRQNEVAGSDSETKRARTRLFVP